jgi:hypothetical protein
MKNLIATLAFFLIAFSLFAQYDRAGLLISTNLGFAKKQDFSQSVFFSSGSNIPQPESNLKAFSIASEVSYVVNEKFMIGFGYLSSSNENTFTQSLNITNQNGVNTIGTFKNNTKINLYGPSLHLRYSQNIISRLIFSLKFTYFNLKGEDSFEFVDNFNNPNNPNSKRTLAYNIGEARFSPSLHYFISQKFGCYIETTGLNFNLSDSRKPNKDLDYNFDLNPNTWRVGLFYFIPTSKAIE